MRALEFQADGGWTRNRAGSDSSTTPAGNIVRQNEHPLSNVPAHMYGGVPTFSCLVRRSVLPMFCLRRAKPECMHRARQRLRQKNHPSKLTVNWR